MCQRTEAELRSATVARPRLSSPTTRSLTPLDLAEAEIREGKRLSWLPNLVLVAAVLLAPYIIAWLIEGPEVAR